MDTIFVEGHGHIHGLWVFLVANGIFFFWEKNSWKPRVGNIGAFLSFELPAKDLCFCKSSQLWVSLISIRNMHCRRTAGVQLLKHQALSIPRIPDTSNVSIDPIFVLILIEYHLWILNIYWVFHILILSLKTVQRPLFLFQKLSLINDLWRQQCSSLGRLRRCHKLSRTIFSLFPNNSLIFSNYLKKVSLVKYRLLVQICIQKSRTDISSIIWALTLGREIFLEGRGCFPNFQ